MFKKSLLTLIAVFLAIGGRAELSKDAKGNYLIGSAQELSEFTLLVRSGQRAANALLTADIDMSGVTNFIPIGLFSDEENYNKQTYNGTFDGGGHTISNLTVTQSDPYEVGLIGRGSGCTIQNLGVINAKITSETGTRVGVLAAELQNSTVRNCYTAGTIELTTEHEQKGGLIGEGTGGTVIANCFTTHETLCASNTGSTSNSYAGDELSGMKKGELCYLLNGTQKEICFYQNLSEDDIPSLNASRGRVYIEGEVDCGGKPVGEVSFTNTANDKELPPHDYDEEGFCTVCGAEEGVVKANDEGWYEISNGKELRYISRYVNKGNNSISIRLTQDIDMEGISMMPIGKYYDDVNYPTVCFKGVFDGQGHIIRNLTIACDDPQETGLFGRVHEGGTIRNLGIVNADISNECGIRTGVLAGEIHACTVTNCFTAGNITINTSHVQKAGLSAEAAASTLVNCYTTYEVLTNAAQVLTNCYDGTTVDETAGTGKLCYMLNGNTFMSPIYYQNIDLDEFPVLDDTHGIVYQTGEDTYSSAKDEEEFANIRTVLLNTEKELYEQKTASSQLVDNYINSLEKLDNATREEYAKGFSNLKGLRQAIKESESAYASYQQKINEILAYLESNTYYGAEFELLNDYLTEIVEPGEKFPNGSYKYIMSELQLMTNDIIQEASYAQSLLDNAVKSNYQPGDDITNMIVNADYSQQLNGWTLEEGEPSVQTNKDYKTFLAQLLTNVNMSQTLHDLRPGLYEVHFSGYAELRNAAEETAYNFTSFVYANGNRNNFHTKFTGLLTEEEGLKELETAPNAFGPVSDAQGNLLGYGATGFGGLSVAFSHGFYDNSIIVAVEDSLKLGVVTNGTYQRQTDTFVGTPRLVFLGNYDEASDALDAQLAQMVETATHITNDYAPDWVNYGNAPSYSMALKEELTQAIAAAQAATSGEAKYQAICKLSQLFGALYESKDAYLQMSVINDQVYQAVSDVNADEADAYEQNFYQPIAEAYQNGSYTTQEALLCLENLKKNNAYRITYGVEPEQDEDDYYLCEDPYHLIWIAKQVNTDVQRNLKFALTKDIDMSMLSNFTPIGLYSDYGEKHVFEGTFDGRGHIISNLTILREDKTETGFFSRAQGATIKNVGIVNADITNGADIRAGVLGGEMVLCTINNVFTAGNLQVSTTHDQAGGLCGETHASTVTNCYTTHRVLTNDGSLSNCYSAETAEGKFETGELCFLLNGDQSKIAFYQKLKEDKYPTLNSERGQVYCTGNLNCDGTSSGDVSYTNTEGQPVVAPHEYDEDGYCINCGQDKGKSEMDEKGFYHLKDAYALRWFASIVNEGNLSAKAVLDNDIDMKGIKTEPIGRYSDDHELDGTNRAFSGILDGQGHEISNLSITLDSRNEGGLFGRVAVGAQIKNFGLVNPTVQNIHPNGCRLGAVCGELNGGTISYVYVVGNIDLKTTHAQVASIAGEAANGFVRNCYSTSDLEICYLGTKTDCYKGNEVAQMASTGELCYKLNGNTSVNAVWRQTLNQDQYPVLREESLVVYQAEDGTYSNEMGEMDKYEGTAKDPIRIKSLHNMMVLHDYLKPGQVTYVTLETDLDMSEVTDWVPLNLGADTYEDKQYMNWINFDGKGHTIKGFRCTKKGDYYNSLFGVLCGAVYNLGLVDCEVDCDASGTGVLAGYVGHGNYKDTTYVCNTYVTGKLNVASNYCGGLFGNVGGATVMRNCYANLNITSGAAYVGGLLGRISAGLIMENCYAAGTCQGHGITGGRKDSAPASVFNNIVVWNNNYQDFGPTLYDDKLTGISYFTDDNFAALQQTVVAWDPTVWSVDGDEYPVLKGTVSDPTGMEETMASTTNSAISNNAVYSLSGVRMGNSLHNLPKGIYIRRGKKILVK